LLFSNNKNDSSLWKSIRIHSYKISTDSSCSASTKCCLLLVYFHSISRGYVILHYFQLAMNCWCCFWWTKTHSNRISLDTHSQLESPFRIREAQTSGFGFSFIQFAALYRNWKTQTGEGERKIKQHIKCKIAPRQSL